MTDRNQRAWERKQTREEVEWMFRHVLCSMTVQELAHPALLKQGSRIQRISRGSGVPVPMVRRTAKALQRVARHGGGPDMAEAAEVKQTLVRFPGWTP